MSADYVRRTYGVPEKRGGRVVVDGRDGVITSFHDRRLMVRFDGEPRPVPAHPTWCVRYL